MPGNIGWIPFDGDEPILFRILGVSYEIAPGGTEDKYIYWDPNDPNAFNTTDDVNIAMAADNWMVCVNDNGVAYPTNMGQFIHGDTLAPESVSTDAIEDNATSISKHTYNASSIACPDGAPGNWTDIATVSITTVGGDVQISISFHTDQVADIRILRDAVLIWESPVPTAAEKYFSFQILETPDAGDYVYHMQARTAEWSGSTTTNIVGRSLTCVEFRR